MISRGAPENYRGIKVLTSNIKFKVPLWELMPQRKRTRKEGSSRYFVGVLNMGVARILFTRGGRKRDSFAKIYSVRHNVRNMLRGGVGLRQCVSLYMHACRNTDSDTYTRRVFTDVMQINFGGAAVLRISSNSHVCRLSNLHPFSTNPY
ncbi:hypothetical protein NQ318_006567 [Aromia moschata]|uniref:Uncharacterized protein n=1 Tax=Aromia moschata TaxID=1265417 RepID=A0AAV8YNQ8_9CUCU|nr:hypothetical protein NQ318_006567 [Aromia moschata]